MTRSDRLAERDRSIAVARTWIDRARLRFHTDGTPLTADEQSAFVRVGREQQRNAIRRFRHFARRAVRVEQAVQHLST